jgi:hypothetical protein
MGDDNSVNSAKPANAASRVDWKYVARLTVVSARVLIMVAVVGLIIFLDWSSGDFRSSGFDPLYMVIFWEMVSVCNLFLAVAAVSIWKRWREVLSRK